MSENKIIYTNKKVLESQTRVQFPRGNKNSNNSITDKEDIIKAVYKNAPNIFYQSVKQGIWDKNVTPVNIQVDSVPNFDNVKDLKNWIQENLNLLGDVTIKDNNRIVHFSKSNIGRSMKGVNRDSAKRESYSGLKELVENAVYGYNKSADIRHSKRNNGQEIYYNAFVYNNKIYGVEISVDIPQNNGTKYSYAGHKIKEMASKINGTKFPDLTDANISISDIQSLFNPADNTVYQSENTARGFYQLDKNLITILKDGNVDTVIHEYAHWYLNTLASLEGSSQKVDDALADIRKFLKNDGSKFSEKQHEKFEIFCIISTDIYLSYKNTADFLKLF